MNARTKLEKTGKLRKIIKTVCISASVTTGKHGAEIKSVAGWFTNEEVAALAGLGINTTTPRSIFVPFDSENVVGCATADINTLLGRLAGLCNYFKNIVEG